VNPSPNNTACAIMKRKRAHDEKLILKHDLKDQPLPKIKGGSDDDGQIKTLEVRLSNKQLK
jgi:hypothetical protein